MKVLVNVLFCMMVFQTIMAQPTRKYGILGQVAPELEINQWINEEGKMRQPLKLKDFEGKMVYIFAFQSWCAGCHIIGFPTLQKVQSQYQENRDIQFLVIQTTFEGAKTNTFDKLATTQNKYDLEIPFGHDDGKG